MPRRDEIGRAPPYRWGRVAAELRYACRWWRSDGEGAAPCLDGAAETLSVLLGPGERRVLASMAWAALEPGDRHAFAAACLPRAIVEDAEAALAGIVAIGASGARSRDERDGEAERNAACARQRAMWAEALAMDWSEEERRAMALRLWQDMDAANRRAFLRGVGAERAA